MADVTEIGTTPWVYEELPSVEDRSVITGSVHDAEGVVLADVAYPEFGPLMAAAPELEAQRDEMLAVCKALIAWDEQSPSGAVNGWAMLDNAVNKARTAIADWKESAMTNEYELGDKAVCRWCDKEIEWQGYFWRHTRTTPCIDPAQPKPGAITSPINELRAQRDALLTYLKAEQAFWGHYADCRKCLGKTFCGDALLLRAEAIKKQNEALARVQEESDAR